MMIPPASAEQLTGEQLIKLGALARQLGVSLRTVHRWRITGAGGRKLACVRYGGTWFTTPASIAVFRDTNSPTVPTVQIGPGDDLERELAEAREAGWA